MRTLVTAFFACYTIAIIGCASGEADKDAKAMQGEWQEVEKRWRYLIKADETTFNPDSENRRFKFKLYPNQSPKGIDLIMLNGPSEGQTGEGIYELEGRRLKICAPNSGKAGGERPKEFKSRPKDGVVLIVLEKVGN